MKTIFRTWTTLLILITTHLLIAQEVNIDSCIANWRGVDFPIPDPFATMLASPVTGTTYYIAPDEEGASNQNNGLFPTFQGGNNGPLKSLNGLSTLSASVKEGDEIILREGIYRVDTTLTIDFIGTLTKPIRISAFPEENPIIEGSFDSLYVQSILGNQQAMDHYVDLWYFKPMIRLSGQYIIIDGLTFRKPHFNQMLWRGQYCIVQNCTFIGSIEDQIKTTEQTRFGLSYQNEFTQFIGEGIDIFGAKHFYNIGSSFHDNIGTFPTGWGTATWSKAGADSIFQINNHFYNLTVKAHALDLGGCCWSNWTNAFDPVTDLPNPTSQHVYAWGNLFENVKIDPASNFRYKGVLTFQASFHSEAKHNLFYNCDDAISIRSASSGLNSLTSNFISITNNIISHSTGGNIYNIIDNYDPVNVIIDSNQVFTNGDWFCTVGSNRRTYEDCRANHNLDTYYFSGTYEETCNALNEITSLETMSVSVSNFKFRIYPNPAKNWLSISTSLSHPVQLQVLSLVGQKVYTTKVQGESQINVSHLIPGIYILQISTGKQKLSKKLVITK